MASKGKLSSSELVTQLSGVVGANTVVRYYCKSVIEQSDIKLAALENLPAHQDLARKHAKNWQQNVEPKIHQCLTDTINFSDAFLGKYDHLNSLIDQMQHGNEQAKGEFSTTIIALIGQLGDVVGHSRDVTTAVAQFQKLLDQDTRNFKSDSEEAQRKIIGENGELKALQDQLSAIDDAINRDIGLIAGGILVIWLAVGGAIDLKKQEDAKHDVQLKIAMERQELMALNAAKSHIGGFLGSMGPASSALTSLEAAWLSLKSDFDEVNTELRSVSSTSAATWLAPMLETAKKDWQVALDKAKQLQSSSDQLQPVTI